jgi:hypothetical protein
MKKYLLAAAAALALGGMAAAELEATPEIKPSGQLGVQGECF